MKALKTILVAGLAFSATAAHAAGFNYLWEEGPHAGQPLRWNTSAPIPIYTDGGEAFTFDYDGVTPFITIERANEITAFAYGEWNNVAMSTFEADVDNLRSIEDATGIADVTGANAAAIYEAQNGYGFWVLYDTDGSILEDYFGAPRTAVLGIAFPELANEATGEITEATAVINGWNVYDTDIGGNQVAGVFTHEFGHTLNLSHTQVNGYIAYQSYPWSPQYPGVAGCGVDPVYRYTYGAPGAPLQDGTVADPATIETMYPFIDHGNQGGAEMSTVEHADDIAALANLYPTAAFLANTGSISGQLVLKDGKTPYQGINVIARNVNDPMVDAVSAMTGHLTQGVFGPDGNFVINGLTPGEEYVVYIEQVNSGGYPTGRSTMPSVAEYWNADESNVPSTDDACDATPIMAEAGATKVADIVFNGYLDGIQYTPIVAAFLTDIAKNGKSSAGLLGSTAFKWDENHDFIVFDSSVRATTGSMNRNGQKMLVNYDFDGNGIGQAALLDFTGKSNKASVMNLGDLNGDTCGGSGSSGVNSSYGWAVDDSAHTAVGTAYIDTDGDGFCQSSLKQEIVPFIWTDGKKGGTRMLSTDGAPSATSFVRAHAISGNGRVVLGNNGGSRAVAWVDEGELVNLYGQFGAQDAYAVSYDGSRVALQTRSDGVVLWNPWTGDAEGIGGLKWCVDLDFVRFGTNFCSLLGPETVQNLLGPISVLPTDMNDDGTVIVGRAGSFFEGFVGAIWIDGLGWTNLRDFLAGQGVAEAARFPMDNPISIDGDGNTMVGGLAGSTFSWHVDMKEVFVCDAGVTTSTEFPIETVNAVLDGAELGRCEHLN